MFKNMMFMIFIFQIFLMLISSQVFMCVYLFYWRYVNAVSGNVRKPRAIGGTNGDWELLRRMTPEDPNES